MDMFNILLSIGGFIIGAAASYIITKHYYKKSLLFETDMRNLTYSLESIYMNSKYSSIFESVDSLSTDYKGQSPVNKDIPHLNEVCCESNIINKGQNFLVLFRMVDLGRNLHSSGIEVRNKLNNYNIPISDEGFGWYSCRISIPNDAPSGNHNILFTFKDNAGNKNNQEFEYTIK